MFLIQILLPAASPADGENWASSTRAELVERFGGMTAYTQAPAQGEWTTTRGDRAVDLVVMVEVVARQFDRVWWRSYAETLARRFRQDTIHIRALPVEMLDPEAA